MNMIINIFASPGEVFASLKEKPRFLAAWLLIAIAGAVVQFFYFSGVDVAWFFEEQLLANPNTTQDQAEQAVRLFTSIPQAGLAIVFALITAFFLTLVFLIQALYFKIASQFTKDGLSYKHLFSLVCWSSMPGLLTSVASIVNLVTKDTSLMPATDINPLTFWGLLDLEPLGTGTLDGIVTNTDPMAIWSLVLLIFGYKIMSGKDWATAAIVAIIPTALIFGLAFIF
jgi:hypothetical protein